MSVLLILILAAGAVMITLYFLAMFMQSNKLLIAFRIAMLILIALLIITWIVSIVLGQHQLLLLGLAIVFILLYAFS